MAEAHASLGMTLDHDYDSVGAGPEFKLAISLNPGYASAHHWYAVSLAGMGRTVESVQEMKEAKKFDPLSSLILTVLGAVYTVAGIEEQAWKEWNEIMKLEPNLWLLHFWRGVYLARSLNLDEAKIELLKGLSISPENPRLKSILGFVFASTGETDKARRILDELISARANTHSGAETIATVLSGLKDGENFFKYMELALTERTLPHYALRYLPQFNAFHSDPRFAKLLKLARIET